MIINEVMFNASLNEILVELKAQLNANKINLFRTFKDSGNNIMTECPYHKGGQERKPSAGFHKDTGVFHCFTCGETHSLQEVISNCFGKDDYGVYGWNWLLKNFLTIGVEERKDVRLDLERDTIDRVNDIDVSNAGSIINSNNVGRRSDKSNITNYISEQELDDYRYIHPYMYERKLTDEIISTFDIGFDKDTESITFPIRDIHGNTLFVARRSTKVKWFNYPSGAEKPLYGLYELYYTCSVSHGLLIKNTEIVDVIVCESMLDALTCWVYGKYAVALNGLGNELQFKQLRELPCRKLILATDNDEAGLKARKRIRQNVKNKIITEYILPKGKKDINELSKEEFDNLEEVF